MCSILAVLEVPADAEPGGIDAVRTRAIELSRRMRHRGPDWSGVYRDSSNVLVHERLAIVGVESGAQPLRTKDGRYLLAVNGEIYNHHQLEQGFPDFELQTNSDCEVILPMWIEKGSDFLNELNGIFAFVGLDSETGDWLIGRDPIGVVPLYFGRDQHGALWVASEMKAIADTCSKFEEFPPGHVWRRGMQKPERYFHPTWRPYSAVQGKPVDSETLNSALESAVERQLMCDVPHGVLLSGGLDSSIVAACVVKHAKTRVESGGTEEAWWPRVHSFAIGLEGSPDLAAAKKVADSLGTVHHNMKFTVQDGLDALGEVIWHLETYDVTSIRASTPMYLLARKIKAMGIKMVLSGEGADEIFGGYLYFHKAPDAQAFHEETVDKLDALHMYDCLRANKSMAAWGVEARVPFLDREFLDEAMSFDAKYKMCVDEEGKPRMEKHILRSAFTGVIPDEILWRQKEQFSDGVGYSWIDSLRDHAETNVSDDQLERAAWRFPHNTPATKEAYLFREIFEGHFPGASAAACVPGGKSVACSTSNAIAWDAAFAKNADPSGRAVTGVHEDSY